MVAMFKKLVTVGEEKLNQLANQVLSNEQLMSSVQDMLKTLQGARAQVRHTVKAGLQMVGVPTLDDVHKLEQKVDELTTIFAEVREQLDEESDR
jgi:hypothetical protein